MNELLVITEKLNFLPDTYKKMIARQLSIGIIGVIILSLSFGIHAGVSFFAGILPIVLGVVIASQIAVKKNKGNPGKIVINALKAEAIKILIILLVLWLEFKLYQELIPLALIIGLVFAAIISGMAISSIDNIKVDNKE